MRLAALFKGKDTPKEEKKEAKAVKTGRITPAQYARGEKMEGEKAPASTLKKKGEALKSGALPASKYAKGGKR